MDIIIVDLLANIFGRIYLLIRYPSKKRRQQILEEEYGSSYKLVFSVKFFQTFAVIFLIGIIGLLVTYFYYKMIK